MKEDKAKSRWIKNGHVVLDLHQKTLDVGISLCDITLNQFRRCGSDKKILIITGVGQNSLGVPVLFHGIRQHIQECHQDFRYRGAPPKLGGDGAMVVERVVVDSGWKNDNFL